MSNVVNNHKYKSQQNNIPRGHQSINTRGSAPVENHRISYSSVARQGIPSQSHPSHEGVIPKSHPTQNTVQQVVITQQTNMSSQVSNVNQGGPQMTNAAVANAGNNQMQVIPQTVLQPSGPRFGAQAFHQQHHQPRPQQQRTLLQPNQRTHNPVPTSNVPQGVHQAVPQNMSHQTHQHYFVAPTNVQTQLQFQNQIFNAHNMTHTQYPHQTRPMQAQVGANYPIFMAQQQPFAAPQATYPAYVYPYHYQTHTQQSAQMIPSQMHQNRGPPVSSQAVIQATQPQLIQMAAPTSNEVNEPAPIPSKAVAPRKKHLAIITDPNSGKNVDIAELANQPKTSAAISRSNESFSGASNQSSALSASSPKLSSNDVNSIGLEFATKVAVAATEPIHRYTTSPNVSESDVSVSSSGRPETEESVAISKTPLNELSETNDKNSDICDNSTDDNNLVINTISTNSGNSAPISGSQTDSKLLNKNSAQNTFSQINSETNSSDEINENGDITDSCNESVEEKEETISIEHSTQKINNNINNNNRKKDMILKEDNNRKSEEFDNKIDNISDVTEQQLDNSVTIVDKLEPQLPSDRSSPVISSTLSSESVDKSVKNDIILNNLSENHSEENDNENNRINEIKNKEVSGEPTESESAIATTKPLLPDLPYKDDQWTPLNPDGKKHYDRDFLFAVRVKAENTLKMPESLQIGKNVEIIRKESSGGHGYENPTPGALFLPNFASRGNEFRNRMMPQVTRRQSQNQPGKHHEKQRKIISTSLTQDVKLHTTDNAWRPSKLAPTTDDPEEKETQELLKKIRGILNKLTPQKYEDLIKQIMAMKIDTEDRLKRVLDLVFEKAVDEPAFCLQYANLCKYLSLEFKVMINRDDNNVEEVKFQKLLIQKCQKEFETEIYASIIDLKERQEEIENTTDPQKRKMLTEILDEDMRRARKRSLGNIKLIGELYKLRMLKANIMVQCIDGLIKDADDESLECLCALLRTIGEQIENEAAKDDKTADRQRQILNNFFVRMEKIAEQKDPDVRGTSARVRFMLRDIIDMRNNNWKARRDENLPKMIDEIHLEAQKEDEQTARELHQHTLNRKQEERERKQKGGRMGNESSDNNQWTTVSGRKSQNASQPNIDWGMIRSQQQQNHETVQLGPQSGSWSLGSRGGAQQSQQRLQSNDDKPVNRFTALDSDRKSSKSIPSRDSSKGRSNQQHGYQSGRGGRSQRGDREDAINLARTFSTNQRQSPSESTPMYPNIMSRNSSRGGSRETSAPNSRNSSMRRETPDSEMSPLKGNIPEPELKHRASESIKEYLNVKNLSEPVYDVTNICNESNAHIYVCTAVECAFDTSSQSQRFAIGKLIDHLIAKNVIKFDHLYKGLNIIVEIADDLLIDIPKMWDYSADVLAPIFINLTQNRKKFILDLIKMYKEDKQSLFVAKIFVSVSNLTSVEKANELWFNSDLKWTEFLVPEKNVEEFVRNNSVEFTLKLSNKCSNSDQNYQMFKKEVEQLVRQQKSNDEIQNYISKHFNTSQTSDHKFTSALFTAVINGCINAPTDACEDQYSYSFEKNTLQTICPLLSKFLGGDAERELQALIALQELMDDLQHPSGLLLKLFQVLNDTGVISQDAFLQWEKSENSRRGKAVAVKSVTSFLTWLCENQEDDDDDDNDTNS